jgi:hypothetical protein
MLCVAGCGDGVKNDEEARRAYLGLDTHIDKSITLGFAGFNAATSANIPTQMTTGAMKGTLSVSGQVDQGASMTSKEMRLKETLVMYSDDGKLIYDTDAATPPALDMSLKMIPTGTLTGSLVGNYQMTGDLKGTVSLNLAFTGMLQMAAGGGVERKPGTTHITGTATSPAGTYNVDVTR